jgi:hypothetical protein
MINWVFICSNSVAADSIRLDLTGLMYQQPTGSVFIRDAQGASNRTKENTILPYILNYQEMKMSKFIYPSVLKCKLAETISQQRKIYNNDIRNRLV